MTTWKKVLTKHGLWIGLGIAVGTFATTAVTHRAGIAPAMAQTREATPISSTNRAESLAALRALDDSFADLVQYVEPAVVHIRAESSGSGEGAMPAGSGGQGSGVIFRPDGWILTNDHVVAGFDKVTVILKDGREFRGTVRRSNDPQNDIAVVKIDAANLPVAQLGDSSKVRAGQFALAVGAPFGLENTVTVGHISGLNRSNTVMNRGYSGLIQTDAPINPGNSGGPLIGVSGEVIGINTAIFSGTGGNVGIGFSIPSNQARLIADMLIEKGKLTRGYLGLLPDNLKEYEAKDMGLNGGAIVRQVPSGGPAAVAGIKPNDVILRIGTMPVNGQMDLRNAMLKYNPGTKVTVEYVRDKQRRTAEVKVAPVPKEMQALQQPSIQGETPDDFLREFRRRFQDGTPQLPTPDETPSAPSEGKPRLGVSVTPLGPDNRSQYNVPASTKGVLVTSIEPGSVADRLGIQVGDVIVGLGGVAIESPEQLASAVAKAATGKRLSLRYMRFGKNSSSSFQEDVSF